MKISFYPNKLSDEKTNVLVGAFESFHQGHYQLLKKARDLGQKIGIVIFKNVETLTKNSDQKYFLDFEARIQNLANLKIDYCSVINFDDQFKKTSGEDFLKNLKKIFNYEKIIVGKDFKFGFNRSSSPYDFLQDFIIIEKFRINNNYLSTSFLKKMIQIGEVATIKEVSNFFFATLITLEENNSFKYDNNQIKPHHGLYCGYFVYNKIKYPSIVYLCKNVNKIYIPLLQSKILHLKGYFLFKKKVMLFFNEKIVFDFEKDFQNHIDFFKKL